MLTTTDTKHSEAQTLAESSANSSGLPQTIFKDTESGGWWFTNSLSDRLKGAQVSLTVLPKRWFE